MAVMYDEVFVLRVDTSKIEVYNSEKLTLRRRIEVIGLNNPWDIAACVRYSCLYIGDNKLAFANRRYSVFRVEMRGNTTRWCIQERPQGISTSADGWTLIVLSICPDDRGMLSEYTTHGTLVRKWRLQDDIVEPMCVKQLVNDRFLVCSVQISGLGPLHRVSIVGGISGEVIQSFDGVTESNVGALNLPSHLDIDRRGNVVVTDCRNGRVLLLDASLANVRELVKPSDVGRASWRPDGLWLEETRGRLYVLDGVDNDLLVFQVK